MTTTLVTLHLMGSGERIRRARERLGMSQGDLARAVSVSRTTVSNWETGATATPRNKLGKVFEVLGLDPEGQPEEAPAADTLRGMQVLDLIDLQGRLSAEIARRLLASQQRIPANGHGEMQRPDLRKHLGQWRPDEGRAEG